MLNQVKYYFLLCVFLITSNIIYAQSKIKKRIHIIEQQRYDLMVKGDTLALRNILADDLEYYHSNGMKDSKTSLLVGIATQELVHKKIIINEENIRIYNNTALVTGKATYDVVWQQKPLLLNFIFTNVYCKQNGKWLLVNRQTVKF